MASDMLVVRKILSTTARTVNSQLKKCLESSLCLTKVTIATVLVRMPKIPTINEPYPVDV